MTDALFSVTYRTATFCSAASEVMSHLRTAALSLLIACGTVSLPSAVFAQIISLDCSFYLGTVQMRWDGKTGEPEPQLKISPNEYAYHLFISVKPSVIRIDGANGILAAEPGTTITIVDYVTPATKYRAHRSSHMKLSSPREGDFMQFENDGFCTTQ